MRGPNREKTMTCTICGQEFVGRRRANFCPECRSKRRRGTYQNKQLKKAEAERNARAIASISDISEIALLAREANMSYGQYVAAQH